jgi:hypothetical protein
VAAPPTVIVTLEPNQPLCVAHEGHPANPFHTRHGATSHGWSVARGDGHANVRLSNSGARRLYAGLGRPTTFAITQRVSPARSLPPARPADSLRKPVPGALYPWVKRASYIELALFAALLLFWLLPGFEDETFVFGLSHGIGFIALCLLVWIAVLRREAPYTLLAATLTPAGPVGSVIAIEWMERRRPPGAEGANTE